MAKAYTQNSVGSMGLRTPYLDEYGALPNLTYYRKHYDKVAAYTVLPGDTGAIFTNFGATTSVTFTLPAIADGPWEFDFVCLADFNIVVTFATADTGIGFNNADLDSVSLATASELMGGGFTVRCNGTYVYALQTGPGGHRQTATFTS